MNTLYAITIQRPDGSLRRYTVVATSLMGTDSACDKALAQLQADEQITGAVFSAVTIDVVNIQ